MSEPDTEQVSKTQQMRPYLIAAAVLLIIVVVTYFWPKPEQPESLVSQPVAVSPNAQDEAVYDDAVKPDVFQPTPSPQAVTIDANSEPDPMVYDADAQADPIIDESDGAVKQALMQVASSPALASLLVNESLLQKFVINVYNMSNREAAPKHHLIIPPEQPFKTYQQADRQWIDASSFQRYNKYVDVFESMEPTQLLTLLDNYRPTIEAKFAEIAPPNRSFDSALMKAIDELLDTPKAPVPIEVYSDSVVFKFKDPLLEGLSGPQKQLLRTGPENMRRIKQVLRDLKSELESN